MRQHLRQDRKLKHLLLASLVFAMIGCGGDDEGAAGGGGAPGGHGGSTAGSGGVDAGGSGGGAAGTSGGAAGMAGTAGNAGTGGSSGAAGGAGANPLGGDCAKFETDDDRFAPSLAAHYLDVHNAKRAEYCLEPLVWDANLAKVAQGYAELGAGNLPHNDQRNEQYAALIGCTVGCPELGENISWQEPWDYWPIDSLAEGWLEEEDWEPGCNYGGSHYTQMVQESTTAVGCGIWVDAGERLHFVCNYLGWQYGGPAFPDENCSCGGQSYPTAAACP